MTDKAILRIAEETCNVLADVPWHVDCKYLVPSYHAALQAARANHEDDAFIGILASAPLNPNDDVNAPQMRILFTQLRIAMESLAGEDGAGNGNGTSGESRPPFVSPRTTEETPG